MEDERLDLFGDPVDINIGPLLKKYSIPPFSVLDSGSGEWQTRKADWMSLGLDGFGGRNDSLSYREAASQLADGRDDFMGQQMANTGSTSVFDPVLCELFYNWFCPVGGRILDPFAGGACRGVMACLLDRDYVGFDIREEQLEENYSVSERLCAGKDFEPNWVLGDSTKDIHYLNEFDFIFSCPPYGSLEVYSDLEADLSNMSHEDFLAGYRRSIAHSVAALSDDSFAVFVVGNYREKGWMIDLVGETIKGFEDAGAKFYNDFILKTPIGTARLRLDKQFSVSRKTAKIHQNILVFVKGDPRIATSKMELNHEG